MRGTIHSAVTLAIIVAGVAALIGILILLLTWDPMCGYSNSC